VYSVTSTTMQCSAALGSCYSDIRLKRLGKASYIYIYIYVYELGEVPSEPQFSPCSIYLPYKCLELRELPLWL
jgi:hypothetical protein